MCHGLRRDIASHGIIKATSCCMLLQTLCSSQLLTQACYLDCRIDDPDPLKLLKRKLAIAIAEENYGLAASVRDHPYMVLHVQVRHILSCGTQLQALTQPGCYISREGACDGLLAATEIQANAMQLG